MLEALRFLFDEAGDRPCVINISLGTNGGPHDGSSLVEKGIDALVAERPGRAVVIAASNSFDDGIHAAGTVPAGGSTDLRWVLPESISAQGELEVWYAGSDRFRAELISPDGQSLGSVALGGNGRVRADDGTTLLFVSHRRADPNNGDNHARDLRRGPAAGRDLDDPAARRAGLGRRLPRLDRAQRRVPVLLRRAARRQPHPRLAVLRPAERRRRLVRRAQAGQAAVLLLQRRPDPRRPAEAGDQRAGPRRPRGALAHPAPE